MVELYDMALLSAQDSFVGQALVINYWTNGVLFGGLIVAFTLIMFIGTKFADQDTIVSMIYCSFFGALVSTLAWLFRYNNEPAIPTLIPILYIIALGFAIFIKQMKGSNKQLD